MITATIMARVVATTRAMIVAVIIFLVSLFYVDLTVKYPLFCLLFAFITTLSFALFGFVIGLVANSFEQLSLMPNFVITPLSFLGGISITSKCFPLSGETFQFSIPLST